MGQKTLTFHFTPIQKRFLTALLSDPFIRDTFYLTGGTALSACYLNHRQSEDIDLFSQTPLDEPRIVRSITEHISPIASHIDYARISDRLAYTMDFPKNQHLKVDIVYYPYKPLESSGKTYLGLPVDSVADIGVNKLMTLSQRTTGKDYVDLYYILKRYTVWDLREGVAHKFKMDIEPFYAASLYSNVDSIEALPIMKKNLSLDTLKTFFRKQAVLLAKPLVRP